MVCHMVVFFINHMHKVGKNVSFYNISSLLRKNQEIVKKKWNYHGNEKF